MLRLIDWFKYFLDKKTNKIPLDAVIGELATEVYVKELAVQACVNLLAGTLAKCEWKTFEKGKEVRKDNYYLLNVEPNQNKSATKFWRDVVAKLVYENEALIIQHNLQFYNVDSFTLDEKVFRENIYKDIVMGDLQLNRVYTEAEVFHLEFHNDKIADVINGLYSSYSKLIAASQAHYKKNNARKGKLVVPTNYPQTDDAQKDLTELLNVRFRRFFQAEGDAVVPLTDGLSYEELVSNIGTKGGIEGRDIRAFIDDVFDFTAMAFQIPPSLLKGSVADTDKSITTFITFPINSLAKEITDEINRKMYGKKAYLEKTYCKLDTTKIKAVEIKDIANALDVLVRIGAYSIDDCLLELGMEPLNTEWSQQRFMTKNYTPVETAIEGGG